MLRLPCAAIVVFAACELPSTSEIQEPLSCDVGPPGSLENACLKANPAPLSMPADGRFIGANEIGYGVGLDASGSGELWFDAPQSGTFQFYLGTPHIPFRLENRETDQTIAPSCTSTISSTECVSLRRVYTYALVEGQRVRLVFGPSDYRYVRLHVQTQGTRATTCSADDLSDEAEACTATTQSTTALESGHLGLTPGPALALDAVYIIQMQSENVTYPGQYAGTFSFTPSADGDYELYRGTPNIGLRVVGDDTVYVGAECSRYIPSTECDLLRRGERLQLRGGTTYTFELGPAVNRNVRVTIRRSDTAASEIRLGAPQTYPAGNAASYVTASDFGGGMHLVVSSPDDAAGENRIYILRNNNGGAFEIVNQIDVSAPAETVVSDFSEDGLQDIVALAWDGQGPLPGSYLVNQGAWQFARTTFGDGRDFGRFVDAANLHSDSRTEIVAAYTGGFVVLAVPSFAPLDDEPAFGADTVQAVAGDFNADGFADVIAGSSTTGAAKLYYGDGSGNVTFAADLTLPGGGIRQMLAVAVDDGQGAHDLVTVHVDGTVNVSHGLAMGMSAPQTIVIPGTFHRGITAGDFNHDNLYDLAVAHDSTSITIVLDDGDGYRLGGTLTAPERVGQMLVASHFNADGYADLVAPIIGGVAVWLGTP